MSRRPSRNGETIKDAIRICSLQVEEVIGLDYKEAYAEWHSIMVAVQRLKNRLVRKWLLRHESQGSTDKLRAYYDIPFQQRKTEDIKAVPFDFELEESAYIDLARSEPCVNTQIVASLQNQYLIGSSLLKGKPRKGSIPKWHRILLDAEAAPQFTDPQPIPIIKKTFVLECVDGKWVATFNIGRKVDDQGKAIPRAGSYRCVLSTRRLSVGKKPIEYAGVVQRIASGEWPMSDSLLIYSKKKKRFFLQLCHKIPKAPRPSIDEAKVMTVAPGSSRPIVVSGESGERSIGDERVVRHVREKLACERRGRQASYKVASRSRKGHGYNRATRAWMAKQRQAWNGFTKNCCYQWAREITNIAIEHGVGSIIWDDSLPPGERIIECSDIRSGNLGWPWYQFQMFVERRCQDAGIKFKKTGDSHATNMPSVS